jgi:hypothetical protein
MRKQTRPAPTLFDHFRVFVVVVALSAGITFIVGAALIGAR